MSDAEAFVLFREGALFGLLAGVLLKIAVDEVAREFRRWRLSLSQRQTMARWCAVTNDCRLSRGHAPPCEPWDDEL